MKMKHLIPVKINKMAGQSLLMTFLSLLISVTIYAQDQCRPVGWATQNGGTTGGGTATPVTVKTISELQTQAKSSGAKVIYVEGTLSGRVTVASDKTIFGKPGALLIGGFDIKDAKNVIVRNMKVQGPGAVDVDGVDCILVDNSTNVWLDHLEIWDGQDGNMDIVNGSNYISVTWTKFRYTSASKNHMFCNLLGNSDSKTTDAGKIKVTMQYNWWAEKVLERMPRVRFGQVHVVNNLFTSTGNGHCVRAGLKADLLVESNVFIGVTKPIDLYENNFTAVTARNNIFTNTSGNTEGKGTSFTPPYSLTITSASQVETLVRNGAGATLTAPTCNITENKLPAVSITSPANQATYNAPASVSIDVNASDPDGSISKVEFYNGNQVLGTDNTSPYSFSWTNVAAGTYTITAKAYDDKNASATSAPVSVLVKSTGNDQAPVVSITAPSNNASFNAPATVTINTDASDADGTVAKVEFYNGANLLYADNTTPFSYTWNNVTAGTYTLTARATDNGGLTSTSAPVTIKVTSGSDCNPSAQFGLTGYATLNGGTTGGAGGKQVTVKTGTDLQNAIKNKGSQPITIFVNGTISPSNSGSLSKIDIKDVSDISIIGIGTSGELNGIGIKVMRASNIIIQNLKIHHVLSGDKDCISIEGPAHHIWVDHCELYNDYAGVDKDYYDGLLDAKAESEYITYSWNYLHDSWKASLVGNSDDDNFDRKITYHHNYFRNIESRLPLFRFGNGHVFNNYYEDIHSTAVNSRMGACVKIENNSFRNVLNPYVTAYSVEDGFGDITGNLLTNCTFLYADDTKELKSCKASIPYSYANFLNCAADVETIVKQNAGVGKLDGVITGNNDHSEILSNVYPNPFSNLLTISSEGEFTFTIRDLEGRTVEKGSGMNTAEAGNSLSQGIYLLEISSKEKTRTYKISKY
jgi:pectate lyase